MKIKRIATMHDFISKEVFHDECGGYALLVGVDSALTISCKGCNRDFRVKLDMSKSKIKFVVVEEVEEVYKLETVKSGDTAYTQSVPLTESETLRYYGFQS